MNYPPGSSPLNYQNVQMGGHHGGPGTPNLMPSPQDTNNDFNNLMKNVPNQVTEVKNKKKKFLLNIFLSSKNKTWVIWFR